MQNVFDREYGGIAKAQAGVIEGKVTQGLRGIDPI
jgi:hypothetical protein